MTLTKGDELDIINGSLLVNGKLFIVEHPDEPIYNIEDGKIVTIFRGHLFNYWQAEEINGYFA